MLDNRLEGYWGQGGRASDTCRQIEYLFALQLPQGLHVEEREERMDAFSFWRSIHLANHVDFKFFSVF